MVAYFRCSLARVAFGFSWIACVLQACEIQAIPPVKPGVIWVLNEDFSDEFNGVSLDEDKWDTKYNFWDGRDPGLFDSSQVSVSGGMLELSVEKPPGGIPDPDKDFYVASINTTGGDDMVQGNRHLLYGYYEVRAKGTDATTTSAFWLSRFTGDYSTEIDIIELVKTHPKAMPTNLHVFKENGVNLNPKDSFPQVIPFSVAGIDPADTYDNSFHTYGMDWNANTIDFYLDDVLVRSVVNDRWHHPMWVHITNGIQDFVGIPTEAELASAEPFLVDYFRVYDTERRNWLGHPGFEYYGGGGVTDAASWNDLSKAWVSRSATAARTGNYGMVVDNSLANDFGQVKNLQPGPQPNRWDLEPGMELEQALWVKLDEAFSATSDATIDLVLRWNGLNASSSSESFDVSELELDTWTELDRLITVPATDHLGQPVEFATAFWMLDNGSGLAPQEGMLFYDDAFLGHALEIVPGDYDRNGRADGLDFLELQRAFGNVVVPGTGADGSADGYINAADTIVWADNYGSGALYPALTEVQVVPEPDSHSILCAVCVGLLASCRMHLSGRSFR